MRFFHQVRSLRGWSRALLVGIALAFGLNSLAHAAHRHDPATTTNAVHSVACGYCVGFGGLVDSSSHGVALVAPRLERLELAFTTAAPRTARPRSSAQPRAPPRS